MQRDRTLLHKRQQGVIVKERALFMYGGYTRNFDKAYSIEAYQKTIPYNSESGGKVFRATFVRMKDDTDEYIDSRIKSISKAAKAVLEASYNPIGLPEGGLKEVARNASNDRAIPNAWVKEFDLTKL